MNDFQLFDAHGYSKVAEIGAGGSSSVYLVESIKYKTKFVLKAINTELCKLPIQREIEALMGLNNPYIIKMYEYFTVNNFLCIVLQYCPKGSLEDEIDEKGPLKDVAIKKTFHQILLALDFCHKKKIAHHDIKPSNILVDEYERSVLADFGLSLSTEKGKNCSNFMGSRAFMAPEQIKMQSYDPFKADIWSLAVTIYMLATGDVPWPLTSLKDLDDAIKTASVNYPPPINDNLLIDILHDMFKVDPNERPTTEELLKNPYFTAKSPNAGESVLLSQQGLNLSKASRINSFLTSRRTTDNVVDMGRRISMTATLAAATTERRRPNSLKMSTKPHQTFV